MLRGPHHPCTDKLRGASLQPYDSIPTAGNVRMLLELYGHEVMRGQLLHLAESAQQGKTTIQVVPYRADAHAGTTGPFVILGFPEPTDPAVVYVGEALRKRLLASMPVDDGEAGRFGEYPRRGVEIRQPGGQSGRR